jgi:hypothetical protein
VMKGINSVVAANNDSKRIDLAFDVIIIHL